MARRRRGHPGDGVLRRTRRPASDRRHGRLGNRRRDHRCLRRNTATRLVLDGGRLVPAASSAPLRDWEFPAPLGRQTVADTPFTEIITMARHLAASRISTCLATAALEDIRNPATPAPQAVDEAGRSAQQFVVDVVVRRGQEERRVSAAGRDIYAVTAPLVAEAAARLADGRASVRGAAAPGEAFDAGDFLAALSPCHLTIRNGALVPE
jgi:hypothetical protein